MIEYLAMLLSSTSLSYCLFDYLSQLTLRTIAILLFASY
jgi:hypothetical protein